MHDMSTLQSIKMTAQQLTESSLVLTIPNAEFPLGVYANSFNVDAAPTNEPLTEELTASVESGFEEINQEQVVTEEEENESLIQNVDASLAKIQFNTQNVIIPAIDSMVRDYNERQSASVAADVRADIFNYDPIHGDPRVTAHVERYANVRPLGQYRTFILPGATTEGIIEMVSVNNPHLDQDQVVNWLLKVSPETIDRTYSALFNGQRMLAVNDLPFIAGGNFPFSVDSLTLAYFLCGHLTENPMDVVGESVDINEWTQTLRLLHEMLGSYLMRAYIQRAQQRQEGVLILATDARNPVENRRVVVTLNGDITDAWIAAGGDIQAALGVAVDTPGIVTISRIAERSDHYVKRWLAVYPLIKQAAFDQASRTRRKDMADAFVMQSREGSLGDRYINELPQRLNDAMRQLREDDLKNPFTAFARLVCSLYFPESTYWDYLCIMDEFGKNYPDASRRELFTQANISLTAIWLASQMTVERFTPQVDAMPAQQALEEPTGGEAEAAFGEASTGEGPLTEEPEAEEPVVEESEEPVVEEEAV